MRRPIPKSRRSAHLPGREDTVDQLIDALIRENLVVETPRTWLGYICAGAVGAATAVAALLIGLGTRPDLGYALSTFSFWMKFTYTMCLSAIGGTMLTQAARPGRRMINPKWLFVPIAALLTIAASELVRHPAEEWQRLWLGHSAFKCVFRLSLLSIPLFVTFSLAVRNLAPTHLRSAGALIGLTSAGIAGTIYGLACTEVAAAFVLTWYSLGIGLSAAVGALLGPMMLRW